MMFTCVNPACADSNHGHAAKASMTGSARRAATAARAPRVAKPVRNRRGRSLRVDIHCHYLNPEVQAKIQPFNPAQHDPTFAFANALTKEVNFRQVRDRGPKLSSIEVRLRDMDRMGIDIQAVSPAPNQLCYWPDAGMGLEIARMVNDRIAEIVATWPDRFVGMGSVPLQDAGLAVRELDRCVKKLGMRGIEIQPSVNGLNLTDPSLKLEKFFARVEDLGVVLFIHPLGFSEARRLGDHYFNNVIGNPLETTIAASHLIFEGVMERHPKLRVVLPHGGGYLAHYWARMDHAHRARIDCRTRIRKAPSSYLKKFFFDTITFDTRMLRQMIDQYGVEHVLLGTDYPYDMGEEDPVGLISSIPGLKGADRTKIMGANAARLLRIKA